MAHKPENYARLLLLNFSPQVTESAGGIEILETLVHLALFQWPALFLGNLRLKVADIDPAIRRVHADLEHSLTPQRRVIPIGASRAGN
jgi:hypothetical protein